MAKINNAELVTMLAGLSNRTPVSTATKMNTRRITRSNSISNPITVDKVSPLINSNEVVSGATKQNTSTCLHQVVSLSPRKAVSAPILNQIENVNCSSIATSLGNEVVSNNVGLKSVNQVVSTRGFTGMNIADKFFPIQNASSVNILDPVVVLVPINPNNLAFLQQQVSPTNAKKDSFTVHSATPTNLTKVNSVSYPVIPDGTQTLSLPKFCTSVPKLTNEAENLVLNKNSPTIHKITLPMKKTTTKKSISVVRRKTNTNKNSFPFDFADLLFPNLVKTKSVSYPLIPNGTETLPLSNAATSILKTKDEILNVSTNNIIDETDLVKTDIPVRVATKRKSSTKKAIKNDGKPLGTLVFFDLETTGLGYQIGKHNVQITEISMIAVDRKQFWDSRDDQLKDVRVMHKLSMCVRPRSSVSAGAAVVTGLNNENLVDQHPFDKNAASTIVSFLSHLPKPVCLLAHNGNVFDFPLLKAELKRLDMDLPSDIFVADTLPAIKSVGISESSPDRKVSKSVKYGKTGRLSHSLENLHVFFFGITPPGGHTSEGDCAALARVCHKVKKDALPWIESNVKTFDSVIPMWESNSMHLLQ